LHFWAPLGELRDNVR